MLRFTAAERYNNVHSYYVAAAIIICLYLACALLFDHLQIHIYRHDSAYNRTMEHYFYNLRTEGRWLNYLLYPVYSSIPGRLAASLDLFFIFVFVFVACNRWTQNRSYSLLIALLAIQIAPLSVQIMWPAGSLPGLFFLALSGWASRYIPLFLFYLLFGVLLLGTLSNLYFLLPLVHLSLLDRPTMQDNFRVLLCKILPGWILGFIAGYLVVLLVLYMFTGEWGIQIASWREPNYIRGLQDLFANTLISFSDLLSHVQAFFSGAWRNLLLAAALMIGITGTNRGRYTPFALLSLAIIFAHYTAVIPAGLNVSFRTAIMTWLGILALLFFYPAIKRWQYHLLLPIIIFMTISFYRVNHGHLAWYAAITNTYYDELTRVTPQPPELYEGLIFLSSSQDVKRVNNAISDRFGLQKGKMEPLAHSRQWPSVARAAGFKSVLLCKDQDKKARVCRSLSKATNDWSLAETQPPEFYRVFGEQEGYLILSLNDHFDFKL